MTGRVELSGPPLSGLTGLDAAQLAGAVEDGERCPACLGVPVAGVLAWEDHGPQQLISVRTYQCDGGHEWEVSTGGS